MWWKNGEQLAVILSKICVQLASLVQKIYAILGNLRKTIVSSTTPSTFFTQVNFLADHCNMPIFTQFSTISTPSTVTTNLYNKKGIR
jgi:hypothetical protein